ncbi:MAG: hypothetical protein IPK07_07735 [Deltaproteobacteria bacterium]|nr:hypothetical protein [Deltaproteobacteria bacterium]
MRGDRLAVIRQALAIAAVLAVSLGGCSGDGGGATATSPVEESRFVPWTNPAAKADAFRLFYAERLARVNVSHNRFLLVGDVVPAMTLGHAFLNKQGDTWEDVLHAKDNNEIGTSAFQAYQAYRLTRAREQALTLIRMMEGLYVAEAVAGIPGLTSREWQPGFTLTIDGDAGSVTRTHGGEQVGPAESYDPALEREILAAFFPSERHVYRADPTDYYFAVEPLLTTGDYALTFVFSELPRYLRVSDCCSSFMVSQKGPFRGYFWGNHNSRDNFPDYGFGYFTALACADDVDADADVRASCARAWAAGQRVGDSVVRYRYNLMTVGESEPYDEDHLIVGGVIRPDGTYEGPEGLGSMNSCQMSYMAKALSPAGLTAPDETVDAPGSYEVLAIQLLFESIGLPAPKLTKHCTSLDDAYIGLTWGDLLELRIGHDDLFSFLGKLMNLQGASIADLLRNLTDAFDQPEKSAAALVWYARVTGNAELREAAKETAYHILEAHRRSAQVLLDYGQGRGADPGLVGYARDQLYKAAMLAHVAGVGNAGFDVQGFAAGLDQAQRYEETLARGDTPAAELVSDEVLAARIQSAFDGANAENQARYQARFGASGPPVRRTADGYEAVGADGAFHAIPDTRHDWFGAVDLWRELPICTLAPTVLDCSWAALGCRRVDLDGSGAVDDSDAALFAAARDAHAGRRCRAENDGCGGADLDRSGAVDADDEAFLSAAQGCRA